MEYAIHILSAIRRLKEARQLQCAFLGVVAFLITLRAFDRHIRPRFFPLLPRVREPIERDERSLMNRKLAVRVRRPRDVAPGVAPGF